MGRKNNSKHHKEKNVIKALAYNNKKLMDRLIQTLLNACVQPTNRSTEWKNFVEIYDIVKSIRQQQVHADLKTTREENMPAFLDWIRSNQVILNENIKIKEMAGCGFGIVAEDNITAGDVLTSIPESLMLTAEVARHSDYFSDFVMSQNMLLKMQNVRLALFLHCEKHNKESFFNPYINILPKTYTTTLYFTKSEMEGLKNTSAFSQAIQQFRSIARQYAIFFHLFHTEKASHNVQAISKIPVEARNNFSFDAYRWAVSSVTTRQNLLPIPIKEAENEFTLGLIPMWDMLNHSLGEMSTDYDINEGRCKCYAMKDFNQGSEVTICYGKRTNSEFLVHNGFIFQDNPFDSVEIALGVSSNDPYFELKSKLLALLGMTSSGKFSLLASSPYVSAELLAFLRIFKMDELQLSHWLNSGNFEALKVSSTETACDEEILTFLQKRIELVLSLCKSEETLTKLIADKTSSLCSILALKLQLEHRKVLTRCLQHCKT